MRIKRFVGKLVTKIWRKKTILTVVFIAAVLRFLGTYPGYNQFHADEGISYSAATSMIKNKNLDPLRYDYPALVPSINYVFFRAIFIPSGWGIYYLRNLSQVLDGKIHIPPSALEAKRILQVEILGERERNALFWGRTVTAVFSLGNVVLIYFLANRLANRGVGLIAAFLLAFNYKHVINSHIGLPDVYNSFFVLLTFYFCHKLIKNPSKLNYLLSGVSVGLSFSIKYQVFAIFPLLLSHLFVSIEGKAISFKRLLNPAFIMSLVSIGTVFLALNPYHVIGLENTLEIVDGVSKKYGMGTKQLNIYPFWYLFTIDYGPPLFILICVGLVFSFKLFFKESLLLLSHAAPFMFIMAYYSKGGFYVRNFITVTPIFIIFASVFIWYLFKIAKNKLPNGFAYFLITVLLVISIYVPGRNALISSYSYTKPWGYDLMRPWVQQNLPKDVIVATHPFDAVNLGLKNPRTEFEVSGAFSVNEHKENKASYLLLDLNWVGNPFYFWMSYGLSEVDVFGRKPLNIMRNMYHGIATEEFFRYQIFAVTKPWQSPDTHLLAIKFFDWPEVPMSQILIFNFNDSAEGWKTYGSNSEAEVSFQHDGVLGKSANGSLVFLPGGARFPTVRSTSPPIEIKEKHLYAVEGFFKTDLLLETRTREGFIRLDFYNSKDNLDIVGQNATVSSRVYGTKDWVNKGVKEVAPPGAKYMTVSFQTYITTRTKIWLDDVVVRESIDEVTDPRLSDPYIKTEVDLNYVYPNSHGNL